MSGWCVGGIILFVYPPLAEAIGPYAILPLPIGATIVALILAKYLPETKGKTVCNQLICMYLWTKFKVVELNSRWILEKPIALLKQLSITEQPVVVLRKSSKNTSEETEAILEKAIII
jgi:hypothetical protein